MPNTKPVGDQSYMRTEEEVKYALDQRIFELYDTGLAVKSISERLGVSCEYIRLLLAAVQVESA